MLIDGLNLAWQCVKFTNGEENRSAWYVNNFPDLFCKFLTFLSILRREVKADPIMVWDGSPKRRQVLCTEYKNKGYVGKRRVSNTTLTIVKRFMSSFGRLGIPQVRFEEEEADDVIASMAVRTYPDSQIFIVSDDGDYLQLVDGKRIWQVRPFRSLDGYQVWDLDQVLDAFSVLPEKQPMYWSFHGSGKSNLSGLGFDMASFLKPLINTCSSIDEIYASLEGMGLQDEILQKYRDFRGQANVNLEILTLYRNLEVPAQTYNFNPSELDNVCREYHIGEMLSDRNSIAESLANTQGFLKFG